MKLQLIKYLNRAGVPHALSLVRDGHVSVRGKIIRNPVYQVKDSYKICVDNEPVDIMYRYILIDKTKGTSCQKGERVPYAGIGYPELFIVGRLDYNTTGMLLLTNDGATAKKVLGSNVTKTYLVSHKYLLTDAEKNKLESGMAYMVKGESYESLPARVYRVNDHQTLLLINQGQYRQVRGMFETLGNPVTDLHRIAIGTACEKGKINPETLFQPVSEDQVHKWLQALQDRSV